RMFSSIFAREDRKEVKSVFVSMQAGQNSKMGEWALITKAGDPLHVSWVCSPMKDEYGSFIGLVAVGRDLTERRKLEMQLVQSQKFAALGVMAGGIAHEIRNPIAICSSAAQFLVEDDISPAFRQECAQKICSGIERASNVIENLLRFARPSTHEKVRWIELTSLIEETMALIVNQAKIQKITVTFQGDSEYTSWVFGNAGLLQQVFLNIFLNAIKAMSNGGNLTVIMWKTELEIKASVADSGQGMTQEEMQKIFDPFYTTSPVGQGTGLGLAVSYSIVQQHSGSIEVNSVLGRGSTLVVSLPLGEEMFRRRSA
ncbi:MAG: PAS domain S-box protein, partial [Desulfohalobiaceae bacterium]|nr:PAS domain S-box protein [Desulfohalobiaceae bacterium]